MSPKDGDKHPGENQKNPPAKGSEHRSSHRYPLQWRAALVYDNAGKNDIYHARTHNLSTTGASIYLDHNIFLTEVVMLLAVPALQVGKRETIIEIRCRMVYTVLDGEEHRFRIGLHFVGFKGNGRKLLTELLSQREIPQPPQPGES